MTRRPVLPAPDAAPRPDRAMLRAGWVAYQHGGKLFAEDLTRIATLVGSAQYEWKKVGITYYVRRVAD